MKDVRLVKPETVTLLGKGNKNRAVPIMTETAKIVKSYMLDRGFIEQSGNSESFLFNSANRAQFTRPGITKILKRYLQAAKAANPELLFPADIHPHALRASKAIHLLESGVNIIAIRDFLGHVSVSTTQVYLQVNSQVKRDAIAQAYPSLVEPVPDWRSNSDLMTMLKNLCT